MHIATMLQNEPKAYQVLFWILQIIATDNLVYLIIILNKFRLALAVKPITVPKAELVNFMCCSNRLFFNGLGEIV